MDIYQIIGFIGMIFIVYAYFLLQANKIDGKSYRFQIINLVGAILLLISLFVHFNLGSFIIEVFWIIITLYGIYNNVKGNNKVKSV
jgi:predicted membrane protein